MSAQIEQLNDIRDKADFQASAHSTMRDHYRQWSSALNIFSLILSACLLFLAMVSDELFQRLTGHSPIWFKVAGGVAALFNFILQLIFLSWRPSAIAADHDQAVRHFARIQGEIRHLLIDEGHLDDKRVQRIKDQFLNDQDFPALPESWFLKLKQIYLRKEAISAELEKNPHHPLWLLELKVWLKTVFWPRKASPDRNS